MKFFLALFLGICLVAATAASTVTIDGEVYDLEIIELNFFEKLHEIEQKLKDFIVKYGKQAWSFIRCMGLDWAEHCIAPTLKCVAQRDIGGCLGLIVCEGKSAKTCSDLVKSKNTTLEEFAIDSLIMESEWLEFQTQLNIFDKLKKK